MGMTAKHPRGIRVAIVGSRTWPTLGRVREYLLTLGETDTVVSGGARGVDLAAETFAMAKGHEVISFRPIKNDDGTYRVERWYYRAYDPSRAHDFALERTIAHPGPFRTFREAALYRNARIANEADRIVAFQHEGSRGTQSTINHARTLAKPLEVFASSG